MKTIYLGLIIVVAVSLISLTGLSLTGYFSIPAGKYDNFAKCLTEKGIIMAGTDWCHYCKSQKEMFGASFQYMNYKNCDNGSWCKDNGISGYPTWIINGKAYPGEQSLESLSTLAGCPLQ